MSGVGVRADRCDACPAERAVTVTLPSGGTLQFCTHHYRHHQTALAAQGAVAQELGHLEGSKG